MRSFMFAMGGAALGVALASWAGSGCSGDTSSDGGSGATTSSGGTTHTGGTSAGGGGAGGTSAGGTSAGGGGAGATGGEGGQGGGAMCGDADVMAAYPGCVASNTQQACEAAGGTWTSIGPSPATLCVCPTGQDNCPCTRSTQCIANCRAETSGGVMECNGVTQGTCADMAPFAGCWCFFDENGNVNGICID